MYHTNDDLRDILKKLDATDKSVLTENSSPVEAAKEKMQSNLSKYVSVTERKMRAPVTGDVLEMIVNEEVVIEMPVIKHDDSSYTLGIDSVAESFLAACGCQIVEAKTHISPSGVETSMDPSDDDYEINYGKHGAVAKHRKELGLDVKTGDKKYESATDLSQGDEIIDEVEYQGRDVELNQPMRGDVKKYKVYVKDPKTGNVKKVNFGDKNMEIKRDDPEARKSFRARHKCDQKKDKTSAGYWSCKFWSSTPVSELLK